MADTKISALSAAASVAAANEFAINEAGTSKKVTGTQIKDFFSSSPTLVTPTIGVAVGTSLNTSAATPLILTNGQAVNIAVTSQTTGNTTLTIPDFASVADEFTFKTKSQTMANKTLTAPAISATTASAGTAMKMTSGTVMTTPEAGALEYDGNCFYASPAASNRGFVPSEYVICLSAVNNLANQTGTQPLFDSVGGGVLTLPTGTYLFECFFSLSAMSAVSGNCTFSIKGGGTATVGSILWIAVGADAAINATGATAGTSGSNTVASGSTNLMTAQTATGVQALIKGTFRITGAGTLIPNVALVTASAAVVAVGSYFKCNCIGSTTMQTVGQWS